MRAVLLILMVVVVAVIAGFATGFLHLNQTQTARVPSVAVGNGGVTATGGQAPTFEVQTGSVAVGTQRRDVTLPKVNVPLPSVQVHRPTDAAALAPTNGAAPAK
ncbi:hypothetical protein [Sphingomonas sp.]|uniref:hypothetical protein n=1 Tax=Sphingomonas sp. TaxID=28214 RepID=UPI00286B77F4|nr:hypothetical protein [Sphingomonas sp.]